MLRSYLTLFILIFSFCLMGCGGESNSGSSSAGETLKEGKAGRQYGGIFRINESEYFRSLFPLNVTEVVGHRITNQIYEGLVAFKQSDLTIRPSLAKSWEVSEDGLTYTFQLREGAYFHDHEVFDGGKGPEVTAHRFKYCLDKLCGFDVNNKGYDFIKEHIKGAKDYYQSTVDKNPLAGGCEGIVVNDKYSLSITLNKPFGGFLNILSLPFCELFAQEAFDRYGVDMRVNAIGTGAFKLKTIKENDAVILVKNENYWGKDEHGNQLPFLDAIRWSFIKDEKAALLKFSQGDLDLKYRFPLEMVDEVLDRNTGKLKDAYAEFQYQEVASMTLQYYGFKQFGDLFNNKKLRQAFNYSIDRKKIVDFTLKGAGLPAFHGVVPPAFAHFDHKAVKGYNYNPDKARKLMAEAGYKDGKGFPKIDLQINSGGGRNEQIAEAIQKMIKENLNIDISIVKMPFAQHLEAVETSKTEFWRSGWIADYPDPENFLAMFWGANIPPKLTDRSYLNSTRFNNAEFNALHVKALATVDPVERGKIYVMQDNIVMEEAPVMPICYSKDRRLLQAKVRNFPQNAMEYRNLRDVYFVN